MLVTGISVVKLLSNFFIEIFFQVIYKTCPDQGFHPRSSCQTFCLTFAEICLTFGPQKFDAAPKPMDAGLFEQAPPIKNEHPQGDRGRPPTAATPSTCPMAGAQRGPGHPRSRVPGSPRLSAALPCDRRRARGQAKRGAKTMH